MQLLSSQTPQRGFPGLKLIYPALRKMSAKRACILLAILVFSLISSANAASAGSGPRANFGKKRSLAKRRGSLNNDQVLRINVNVD